MIVALPAPAGVTLVETKRIVGWVAASNQSALFSSLSSVALVVETDAFGMAMSTLAAEILAGSSDSVPVVPLKSPYQSEKPICETVNWTRVWDGSTP